MSDSASVVAGRETPRLGVDQRMEAVLVAAERLFHERGYHGVTVRDLVKAAGVKMASLYYYFDSKERILYEVSKRTMCGLLEDIEQTLESHGAASAEQRLRAAIVSGSLFHIKRQSAAGTALTEARHLTGPLHDELQELIKRYERIFLSLVDEIFSEHKLDSKDVVMATYIILSALTRIATWYRANGRLGPDQLAASYADLLVGMILYDGAGGFAAGSTSMLLSSPVK